MSVFGFNFFRICTVAFVSLQLPQLMSWLRMSSLFNFGSLRQRLIALSSVIIVEPILDGVSPAESDSRDRRVPIHCQTARLVAALEMFKTFKHGFFGRSTSGPFQLARHNSTFKSLSFVSPVARI